MKDSRPPQKDGRSPQKDSKPPQTVSSLIAQLKERAKELNCLYQIEELLGQPNRPLKEVFEGVIRAIPPGWQFPEICQVRITYLDEVYTSADFKQTPWMQSAILLIQDSFAGEISVYYAEEMPTANDGPFLKEETKLIKTIAERLSHFILHQKLKHMFENGALPVENPQQPSIRNWHVALDLLHSTDNRLLWRVSRKMINYLCWRGIGEARTLLLGYGEGMGSDDLAGETNQPRRKKPDTSLSLSDETFRIAMNHLSDEEILALIQEWIKEDKSSFLVKVLGNSNSSISQISDALRRYQHMKPHGVELSQAASSSARAALIRRFITDQLDFINVAKKYLEIDDFMDIIERIVSTRAGRGQIGGKSAGLFLAGAVLKKTQSELGYIGEVKIPKTWYIASDGLIDFLNYNNLDEVYEHRYKNIDEVRQDYPHIVQLFKNSHFPEESAKGIALILDSFDETPLIVRSSSLLEDRIGSAFSGKYKSLFLANQGDRAERLEALKDAIAEVYASTFAPDPIEYRAERGLLDFNEEMGILIQEVVGKRVGRYFMPAFAGVAFSNNELKWSPRIKREDGLVRIVPGLGTRAVDRLVDDYPILIAPSHPGLRVNVSAEEAVRYSPKNIDVINLEENSFETLRIADLLKECGDDYPALDKIVSFYHGGCIQSSRGTTCESELGDPVVTFEGLISDTPFVKQVEAILKTLKNGLGAPVDIEFASDGSDFFLLQCRSQTRATEDAAVIIPANTPQEDTVFTAKRYVSNGRVSDITHVVYIVPEKYAGLSGLSEMRAVGEVVGKLNKFLPKRRFVLIGPGRWGSRGDIRLGVRVTYSDINNTAMLIEVARKKDNYVPDLSFGTHFFQDLVEASIRYLPLYPDDSGIVFNEEFLSGSANLLADILPEYGFLSDTVRVIDVPSAAKGKVMHVLMNADQDEAICLLADPSYVVHPVNQPMGAQFQQREEHWRWRQQMAERIASEIDPKRFGVKALYLMGSVKNATAGPGSDIDLLIHFDGDEKQRRLLEIWLDGWSLGLDEMNYLRTGYRSEGLLDAHIITDEDMQGHSSYAVKIGAATDAARRLPLKRTAEVR